MSLHLDVRQTRRLYLAGTVSFPTTFPSSGYVAIVRPFVQPDDAGEGTRIFVQLRETCGLGSGGHPRHSQGACGGDLFSRVARAMRSGAVAPEQVGICDFEEGVWFLKPHIDAQRISDRLRADITTLESGVQGIVFVPEHRPVLTITECTQTARAAGSRRPGHASANVDS